MYVDVPAPAPGQKCRSCGIALETPREPAAPKVELDHAPTSRRRPPPVSR
jgi:hypothetical protein